VIILLPESVYLNFAIASDFSLVIKNYRKKTLIIQDTDHFAAIMF